MFSRSVHTCHRPKWSFGDFLSKLAFGHYNWRWRRVVVPSCFMNELVIWVKMTERFLRWGGMVDLGGGDLRDTVAPHHSKMALTWIMHSHPKYAACRVQPRFFWVPGVFSRDENIVIDKNLENIVWQCFWRLFLNVLWTIYAYLSHLEPYYCILRWINASGHLKKNVCECRAPLVGGGRSHPAWAEPCTWLACMQEPFLCSALAP
jgi:hypothetical protein